MRAERSSNTVLVQAPAKVNLFLEVLKKRPDGYHDILTCMAAVDLFDTLEFKEEPSRGIRLTCDEPTLSTGPENLVVRAAELFARRASEGTRGARVHLTKRIPLAAGLAGGSTDAAATLVGLNELWNLGLPLAELVTLAEQLGSDVPFFLLADAAWCTGRGEKVTPFKLKRALHLVLVNPGVPCSTAEVYRGVTVPAKPQAAAQIKAALESENVEELGSALFNRLQESAERLCPEVAALRKQCEDLDPPGHLMSGSGSTYFMLARDRAHADQLARDMKQQLAPEARVFVVQTLVSGE